MNKIINEGLQWLLIFATVFLVVVVHGQNEMIDELQDKYVEAGTLAIACGELLEVQDKVINELVEPKGKAYWLETYKEKKDSHNKLAERQL